MTDRTPQTAVDPSAGAPRRARVERATGETQIRVALDLDRPSPRTIDVPDGFFAHMLDALTTHGGLGVEIEAQGDTEVDLHHTVEDVGIVLGDALREALGDRRGVVRFASAYAPLDEALARAVVDLSGRGFFVWSVPDALRQAWVTQTFPLDLTADFFQAFADRGRFTLHLDVLRARNAHHAAEAAFKAAAVALRQAVALRRAVPLRQAAASGGPQGAGAGLDEVPSTKGALDR